MLVLGAIVDQEQHAGCGEALNQAVQERLGLVSIQCRFSKTRSRGWSLPEEQALDGLQGALAALWWIEGLPRLILDGHVQERQEGREGWPKGCVQCQELPDEPLTDTPLVIALLDLEVAPEQVADGEVGRGLAVGDRAAFELEPALGVMGPCKLVEEARFALQGSPMTADLPVAALGPIQGLAQGLEFRLPPYEAGEPAGRKRLQARPGGDSTNQLEHVHGLWQPLDRHRAVR